MVSLYDSFAMFPTAHHHHHHPGVGVAGGAGHPAGHSILTRHGHPAVGAPQLNLHHQHHQTGVNQAYFGYSAHPAAHHYGQSPSHQYPHSNMMGNATAAELHPQQFGSVGGLVSSDGSSWHTPAVYSGLSGVSPRTPAASGYEDWASSPTSNANNNGPTNAANVVSSPDGSPSVHPHYQQSASPVDGGYSAPYTKLFVSTGGPEFVSPHGSHLNAQLNSGQDIVSITPIPHGRMAGNCNAVGPSSGGSNVTSAVVGAGHHSPDSGLAGSDGLSSAGSPAQHQHPGILGSNTNNPLMNNMNNSGSNSVQPGQASANGSNSNLNMNNMNISRPQPSRSPFEWMKKPNYSHQSNPTGKTRTKDKYRVVYTDHQRLELEKEFHYSRYITIRRKSELASVLGLSERQVKIWFQNRRAKERKQVKKREEMLHKEKLDVVTTHPAHPSTHIVGLHAQQQQQQQQQQQHQAAMNVVVQQQQQQVSSVALGNHAHLAAMVDTKPVLGLIE